MLQVLCSASELGEWGERLAVGDRIRRASARVEGAAYGTALDAVAWRFDRHAEVRGGDHAVIEGTVRSIDAVWVDLVELGRCEWVGARGSAHLEPVRTTADARPTTAPLPGGVARAPVEEGDEHLDGWLVTLDDERIDPA